MRISCVASIIGCGLVISIGSRAAAQSGAATLAGADTTNDPVQTLVDRLDLERYKNTIKGLAQFGDRRQGTKRNRDAVDAHIEWNDTDETTRVLLCDAQTSGGLLAAVPPDEADAVVRALDGELAHAVIGRISDGEPGRIVVA